MQGDATKAGEGYGINGGGGSSSRSRIGNGGDSWMLENPFSFKVLQVFTGVGVGCGIGVGVGRPIYLGAIPAFQQVLSATRGAMDVFSGAGRHVNSNLRRLGVKHLEAGIGCGVGVGHGFGVGIALKPGVIHKIQTSLSQAVAKLMTNFGTIPGVSTLQSAMTGSVDSSADMLNKGYSRNAGPYAGNVLQLATEPDGTTTSVERSNSFGLASTHGSQASTSPLPEKPASTHTESVVNTFLQNPLFKDDQEKDIDKLVAKLRSENNVLQMVLKHQKVIDELIEENERLRQILVEELKISPAKFQSNSVSRNKMSDPCSDCIGCRRKRRAKR